jgi:hypothetical protein
MIANSLNYDSFDLFDWYDNMTANINYDSFDLNYDSFDLFDWHDNMTAMNDSEQFEILSCQSNKSKES